MGTKKSFTKKSERFFLKGFSKFAKGIYETCNLNFFNLAFIVVAFSIAQFILFLHFASNN